MTTTNQIRRQTGPAAAKKDNDRNAPGNSLTNCVKRTARRTVEESNNDRGHGNQTPIAAKKSRNGNRAWRTGRSRAPNHATPGRNELNHISADLGGEARNRRPGRMNNAAIGSAATKES
ncbi:MAG: hypothetical protein WC490_00235 [Candidatus Margulisiibacteriota bacterium]